MSERDYPKGHPAASDYAGEPYIPPRAPFTEDWPVGHPARGGKNVDKLSTPDGLRAQILRDHAANVKRTAAAAKAAEQTAPSSADDLAGTDTE